MLIFRTCHRRDPMVVGPHTSWYFKKKTSLLVSVGLLSATQVCADSQPHYRKLSTCLLLTISYNGIWCVSVQVRLARQTFASWVKTCLSFAILHSLHKSCFQKGFPWELRNKTKFITLAIQNGPRHSNEPIWARTKYMICSWREAPKNMCKRLRTSFVNSQLVCLRPVGILNNVMFNLNCLFQLFEWHACKLACVAKCMSTINKHLFCCFVLLFCFVAWKCGASRVVM